MGLIVAFLCVLATEIYLCERLVRFLVKIALQSLDSVEEDCVKRMKVCGSEEKLLCARNIKHIRQST
jgi:hypothetical protein